MTTEIDEDFDPKKIKKVIDDLEIDETPVVVDGDEEEVEGGDDEEGVLEEEINPFGDRWEE